MTVSGQHDTVNCQLHLKLRTHNVIIERFKLSNDRLSQNLVNSKHLLTKTTK